MSAEQEEKTGSSTGARRRGTRGGRGRKRASESSNGAGLNDPRIAGRRPSRAAAKEEEAAPEPAEAKEEEDAKSKASTAKAAEPKSKPATRRRRKTTTKKAEEAAPEEPEAADGLVAEVRALREAIEEQSKALGSLRETHERTSRRLRLGVFVDVPNLIYGAERGEGAQEGSIVNMGKLLAYLSEGRELIRATAYSPVSDDPGEPVEQQRFVMPFVRHDYRIVTKPMKRFADGSVKGNFDVEMALDMVTMADRLDVVAIVSGDADFARAVELLQGKGVRVEVVAFSGSTSVEMRALADHYIDVGTIMDRVGA